MPYFKVKGRTRMEVLRKIEREHGPGARIIMEEKIPGPGFLRFFGKEWVEYSCYSRKTGESSVARKYPFPGEQNFSTQSIRDNENQAAILASVGTAPAEPMEKRKSNNENGMDEILSEIRNLKREMAVSASVPAPEPFPLLAELENILIENEFTGEYIRNLKEHILKEHSAADLEDRKKIHQAAALYIMESMNFQPCKKPEKGKIIVLVGPTGVGKTTTIAKLTAKYKLEPSSLDVKILTIDTYRIGALAQLETYGNIMDVPVKVLNDNNDYKTALSEFKESDLILVDTIGASPKDTDKIKDIQSTLSIDNENEEIILTVSATTKTADFKRVMEQFSLLKYQSLILTKMDETTLIGNIISVVASSGIPLSYITIGQKVPWDIAVATPGRFLSRIDGLDYESGIIGD